MDARAHRMIEPGEATAFEALTDVVNVVVNLPSAKDDKFLGRADGSGDG